MKDAKTNERFFSVELKSKTSLKNITMTNGSNDGVLVEGTIGKLMQATFEEDLILEVVGEKGVLRINLEQKELKKKPAEVKKQKMNTQTIIAAVVIFIWVISAIKTVIPNADASKACLIGYKATCSFTPISTAICLIGAVISFVVAKRLMVI